MPSTYRDLIAWQLAMELVKRVYVLTSTFPGSEKFGLVSQIRKCAVSVPSNIAEGAARGSKKEFTRLLYIARGSLAELQTQLQLSENLEYCTNTTELEKLSERIHSLIQGLIRKANS